MTTRIPINLNDSAWLRIETERTPMHVATLSRFKLPDDAPSTYLTDLVARWREVRSFEPPFNYRLRGSAVPRWEVVPDEDIDLEYHFRHSALPAPGGERELGMLVSRLHTSRLNRDLPLWEVHVIEGLEGGRWSLYAKVHHSQFDGMAGIRLLRRWLSVDPDARDMLPPWVMGNRGRDQSGLPPREPAERPEHPTASIKGAAASTGRVLGALRRTYAGSVRGPREPERAVPYQAPGSILNRRVNSPRRFATQHYPIARLRAVASAAGGSLNDVFLAICGAALRRHLSELGALPERDLTATVPVAVQQDERVSSGNAITFLFAYLGTNVEDPKERMAIIQASTRAGKQQLPQVGPGGMSTYTVGLMGTSIGQSVIGLGGRTPAISNLVISNVPGPSEPRYFDGSLLENFYPVSLILQGQALNITAVSYCDEFNIGYTGCRDAVPHLQRIAVYSGEALEELERAYGVV